jgi:hypothetical protein
LATKPWQTFCVALVAREHLWMVRVRVRVRVMG